ncbi:MAG: hypothetical protein H7839_24440, partial [Magnetococcus sp. YQC-5]
LNKCIIFLNYPEVGSSTMGTTDPPWVRAGVELDRFFGVAQVIVLLGGGRPKWHVRSDWPSDLSQ